MRYALARLVIAVGRMVSALGWRLMPRNRRMGHYIGRTFPRERLIDTLETKFGDSPDWTRSGRHG